MPTARPYRINQAKLQEIMKARRLKHKEVYKPLNVCRSTFRAIRKKDPFVKKAILFRLANVLQVAPWELCDKVVTGIDDNGKMILTDYTEAMFQDNLIPGIGGNGGVGDVFKRIYRSLAQSTPDIGEFIIETSSSDSAKYDFDHIDEYWDAPLQSGDLVSIKGVLSPLSPVLIGHPEGLLDFHKRFRDLADRGDINSSMSNPNVSISAGQLAWNVGAIGEWRVFGLYHSIVRVAIVVFIDEHIVTDKLKFAGPRCRDAAEAEVTGRVTLVSGFFDMITGPLAEDNDKLKEPPRALVVSRQLEGTTAVIKSSARHLDGDLFCVIDDGEGEKLFTCPTVLSNPGLVDQSLQSLRDQIKLKCPAAKTVIEYNNLGEARNAVGVA